MKLSDKITGLRGIGPKKAEILSKYGIDTIEDMVNFLPRRYEDRRFATDIKDLTAGKDFLISGKLISRRLAGNTYKKNAPLKLYIDDGTGTVEITYFNGRFLSGAFDLNLEYTFFGRVTVNMDRYQMIHPEFYKKGDPRDIRGIVPVYPQVSGISQNEIRRMQADILMENLGVEEWLPEDFVKENKLASLVFSLENIHFPKEKKPLLQSKFRLVFDELFTLETGLFYIKNDSRKDEGGIIIDTTVCDEFIDGLNFELTEGQKQACDDIRRDLNSEKVMNRLIQGDVGSGKTVVAEIAMFASAQSGYQSVMMAPTELLAKQHFHSLTYDFKKYGIEVGLLCSSMKAYEKMEVTDKLASGEIQILVGTHAVIQPGVEFNNLGLVITDEQHRFGVNQRQLLSKKGRNPNVMVMTATPIPRTMAVIIYGDLDISQIRTMPQGRIPVKTISVKNNERKKVYDFVENHIKAGRQAYVVAPLIEESDKVEARSAEELYKELSTRFKNYRVALIHGAMKQEEKDFIMGEFAESNIDLLISTIVIEVGINVANATVMVLENCERFGLAQMHQLRGRVGRGSHQSHCFLISGTDSDVAKERNLIMCNTTDGFEIAEEDLRLRGPGEIFGTRQHGLPELHIADLVRHGDVLEKAKQAAKIIIDKDPNLTNPDFTKLKMRIKKMFGDEIKLEL